MQPHSHGNHDFPICINHYVRGLAELQQLQHATHNQQQQPQYQPLQHQQQCQGHAIPIYGPHINASSTLSYPSFNYLFEKQGKETNQFINNQVKIHMYHNF